VSDELELKFAVGRAFSMPDLAGVGSVARMLPLPTQELRATYYDTVDRRLARWGITLRHRDGEEDHPTAWTLKLPYAAASQVSGISPAFRAELDAEGSPDRVPATLADLVTAHIRSYPLAPAAVLSTRRGRWQLVDAGGRSIAELVDDEVSVMDGNDVRGRFSELELEARGASIADLQAIADRLLAAGAVGAEPIPKAVRALGPTATGPPDVVIPEFGPEDPAGWAVRAALADGLLRILTHDPGTRIGSDESLHQLRVAVRRVRSDLGTLRSLLSPGWAPSLQADLGRLADRLGAVRDLDVLLTRLESSHGDLATPLEPMLNDLRQRRIAARGVLLAELRSDRYAHLLERLVVLARDPKLNPAGLESAGAVLPTLGAAAWRRLEQRADKVTRIAQPGDDQLHAVRIAAKRARYAAETAARGLPAKRAAAARAFADQVGGLQDLLGRHQDAVVAAAFARAAAAEHAGDLDLAIAAGRLTEREMRAARRERRRLGRAWSMLRRRRHRRWMER